jgi:hypothetical protein
VNPDDGVRHTTSELGASHFDRISAHHHISERDKIALLLVFNARHWLRCGVVASRARKALRM